MLWLFIGSQRVVGDLHPCTLRVKVGVPCIDCEMCISNGWPESAIQAHDGAAVSTWISLSLDIYCLTSAG
jgi:hypothetical protein